MNEKRNPTPAAAARESTARANATWEALSAAYAVLDRYFDTDQLWTDLSTHEYAVMYTLSKRSGPVRMRSLSEAVSLSQPGLSRLVDRLAARGLVQRLRAPQDGRGVLVELTDQGRTVERRVERQHSRSVAAAIAAALKPAEQDQLRVLCARLARLGGR